jgi:peptidoglycan/xylan/chitin deacetylase (PgdA/CDA1 family)
MWILVAIGTAIMALTHTAPAPFVLDAMSGDRAIWHMPPSTVPTVYLTFDDGPNPLTTPDLLDVLRREGVRATFFLIDRHITAETAPIVRRMFMEGHAVALHSASRKFMIASPHDFARTVTGWADRIASMAGSRPCRAFRPHAGWRGSQMYSALREIDYTLVGWSWMLWDFNWGRERTADATLGRVLRRAKSGDIIVMHDGDESAPREDQRQTVDATARLIPALRARGFEFGTVCRNEG